MQQFVEDKPVGNGPITGTFDIVLKHPFFSCRWQLKLKAGRCQIKRRVYDIEIRSAEIVMFEVEFERAPIGDQPLLRTHAAVDERRLWAYGIVEAVKENRLLQKAKSYTIRSPQDPENLSPAPATVRAFDTGILRQGESICAAGNVGGYSHETILRCIVGVFWMSFHPLGEEYAVSESDHLRDELIEALSRKVCVIAQPSPTDTLCKDPPVCQHASVLSDL
jgi:hypothetical protein